MAPSNRCIGGTYGYAIEQQGLGGTTPAAQAMRATTTAPAILEARTVTCRCSGAWYRRTCSPITGCRPKESYRRSLMDTNIVQQARCRMLDPTSAMHRSCDDRPVAEVTQATKFRNASQNPEEFELAFCESVVSSYPIVWGRVRYLAVRCLRGGADRGSDPRSPISELINAGDIAALKAKSLPPG